VVDGETGIVIPPQNPDALAQQMGKAAFERIKATFTLENQARTLTELYRRVAQKS
jgi:hypothetical protein